MRGLTINPMCMGVVIISATLLFVFDTELYVFKNYDIKVSKYVKRDSSRLFLLLFYHKHKDFDTTHYTRMYIFRITMTTTSLKFIF